VTGSELALVALGGVMALGGLALVGWSGRGASARELRVPGVGRFSSITTLTAGLALIFMGYHTAAYGGPAGLIGFHVPARLGWLVYTGGVLAVIGAVAADRLEARGSGPEQ